MRREARQSEELLFFNVTAFGREFHLRLQPNRLLVAPNAMVEWHDQPEGLRIQGNVTESRNQSGAVEDRVVKTELLQTDCTFIGDITDMPGASVAINNCDGLVGGWFFLVFLFFLSLPPSLSLAPVCSFKC